MRNHGPPRELSVYREATSAGLLDGIGHITARTTNHYASMMKWPVTTTCRDPVCRMRA